MPTPTLQLALISKRPAAPTLTPALVLGGTALLAAACFAILNRSGLKVSPDGWAYWEGAVSLAEGRGYSYFSGNPILAWPPLYSLYLALWSFLFGPTALSVSIAMGVLVSLQAVLWLGLVLMLAPRVRRPLVVGLVAVFIVAFLELNQRLPLAHSMLYLFLPLQLILLLRILRSRLLRSMDVVGLVVASCMAALSHHLGLAFTASICAAAALMAARRPPVLAVLGATVLMTAGAWALSRLILGQAASHAVGPGQGVLSPLDYLQQGVSGCAELLAPGPAGWVILAVVAALTIIYRKDEGVRLAAGLAALLFATSLAMFVLVHIKDPFSGRFLHFAPLLVIPPLMLRLAAESRVRFSLFAALVMPNLIYASVQAMIYDRDGDEVPMTAAISREAPPGAVVVRDNRLLVGPTDWEEPTSGPPRTAAGR